MNLGAIIQRDYRNVTHKDRDAFVGAAVPRPETYLPDISWLTRNSQKQIPACSSHAASHLKAILDSYENIKRRLSPISGWRAIKTIVKDGFPTSMGTTIEALFKMLKGTGMTDWDLLPTDFAIDEQKQAYTPLTQEQLDNAQPKIIKSYAVTYYPSRDEIKDILYKDKVAILLLRFDDRWWRSDTLIENGEFKYGHFVCAYGYDKDYIYIIDSADDNYPYKKLGMFFQVGAIGSAIDMPDEEVKRLVQTRSLLQKIVELYRQLKTLLK